MYFVKITAENKTAVKKFLKNNKKPLQIYKRFFY
jgi:hypothetical protein